MKKVFHRYLGSASLSEIASYMLGEILPEKHSFWDKVYCLGSVVALGIVARTGWDRGPTAEPQKPDGGAGTPKRKTILLLSRCINGSVTCIKK